MEGYRGPTPGHPFDDATRLDLPVPPCRETFTVPADFLGSASFGQQVLCKTNTLLLDWSVARRGRDGGGRMRDVEEDAGDIRTTRL